MALKATIYKVQLSVSNIDNNHYGDYSLTVAQHPSENESRMLYRLSVFTLLSAEEPTFTKGLSTQDEPEIWCHNQMGEIEHWVELGTPDIKRIKQACGKSKHVSIYTYRERASKEWYESIKDQLGRFKNLNIIHLTPLEGTEIGDISSRAMEVYATIQDNELWLSRDQFRAGLKISKVL